MNGTYTKEQEKKTREAYELIRNDAEDMLPVWMEKDTLNEPGFAESFLKRHPMICLHGYLYDADGRVNEEKVKGEILELVRPFRKTGIPKLLSNLTEMIKKYVKSYSLLQDQLFEFMSAAGFTGFHRGERGSTAEHLTSLEYQIRKDTERIALAEERLSEIEAAVEDAEERYAKEEIRLEQNKQIARDIWVVGKEQKKNIMGKYILSAKDLEDLTAFAKEGLASRGKISRLEDQVDACEREIRDLHQNLDSWRTRYRKLAEKYAKLVDATRVYMEAVKNFPEKVRAFLEKLVPPREIRFEKELGQEKERGGDVYDRNKEYGGRSR